ncbi:hypothetical protein BG005_001755 [Podila minutissima]|nr:hypothetical protein BG005_001755 [Podila minutissima]
MENTTNPRTMGDSGSSGWYIYAVLVVTATIAVVFFGRVCHAKRKERIRAEKDRACEGTFAITTKPPSYSSRDCNRPNIAHYHRDHGHIGPIVRASSLRGLEQMMPTIKFLSK